MKTAAKIDMIETELYMNFSSFEKRVKVTSENATKPFTLHEADFGYIYEQIEGGDESGELEVIVDEGLILINWEVIKEQPQKIYEDYADYILEQMTSTDARNEIIYLLQNLKPNVKEDLEETIRTILP